MKLVSLDQTREVAYDPYDDALDRLFAAELLASLSESDADLLLTVASVYPDLQRAARELRMKAERLRQEIDRIRTEILQKLGGNDGAEN